MKTYGDWFTGFGGMTLGAIAAGLKVIFGAEYDSKIADVYRKNIGDHIRVCNLLDIDVSEFERVDVFHASPPCPNFSNAKANAQESEIDIALSAKVAEYIAYHLPDVFTLENVYQYRNSKSWQTIARTLHTHGYLFNYWHVNMADYGVPQTRQRMIVIARRNGVMPRLPEATHTAEPQPGLFGTLKRWVSWYEAIEDLIPTLPDSEFSPWQIERLPDEVKGFSNHAAGKYRAVIVDGYRAVIVDGQANADGKMTLRGEDEPIFTQTATMPKRAVRSSVNGRVVQMTPRALARFQSFPDWYELPESKKLACQGIGNAVPPLFAEKLYKHLLSTKTEVQ